MLERPDAFNTEITRFLDRLPREDETVPADLAPSRGRTQPSKTARADTPRARQRINALNPAAEPDQGHRPKGEPCTSNS
jgi:hypothetical protein